MDKPYWYEICIEGHLSEQWSDWFEGLVIRNDADGVTRLRGTFVDQAALLGVLNQIQGLNLVLVSVNRSVGASHRQSAQDMLRV